MCIGLQCTLYMRYSLQYTERQADERHLAGRGQRVESYMFLIAACFVMETSHCHLKQKLNRLITKICR
jgi:hypothetical protein